jgi:hypothetical protein
MARSSGSICSSRGHAHARGEKRLALAATGKDERARREGGKHEDDERNGCSCK